MKRVERFVQRSDLHRHHLSGGDNLERCSLVLYSVSKAQHCTTHRSIRPIDVMMPVADSFRTNSGQFNAIFVIYMLFNSCFTIFCPFISFLSKVYEQVEGVCQTQGSGTWDVLHAHMGLTQYSPVPLDLTITFQPGQLPGQNCFHKKY